MSDFKQGETVLFIDEAGKHLRSIDHVTKMTGIIALVGEKVRFRQDGTATNNFGREHIEHLPEGTQTPSLSAVHAAMTFLEVVTGLYPSVKLIQDVLAMADIHDTVEHISMCQTIMREANRQSVKISLSKVPEQSGDESDE
jgi:hypothetical protein